MANQFMQYEQESDTEKQEMKDSFEEKQHQLESLLQEQNDKIIEMQKTYTYLIYLFFKGGPFIETLEWESRTPEYYQGANLRK